MSHPDPRRVVEVAGLVAHVTGRPSAEIRPEHRFVDDLGIDSLAMLDLLQECRRRLGVEVPSEATRQLVHVGDLADYLSYAASRSG